MINRILVAYDGSRSAKSALRAACHLGKFCGAEILGIFVEDERRYSETSTRDRLLGGLGMYPIEPSLHDPEKMVDVVERCEQEVDDYSKEFNHICKEYAVSGSFLSEFGIAEDVLSEFSRSVDIVFAGNSGSHSGLQSIKEGQTAQTLLHASIVPVLIVPEKVEIEGTILIAYDASPASERVLRVAAELAALRKLSDVHLVTVDSDKERARSLQDVAVDYLEGCGFVVHTHLLEGTPSEAILECASELKPSFIAAGWRKSGKLSKKLFGSTVEDILESRSHAVLCTM